MRLLGSVVMGLTMVRAFILVHDLHHGAIFRRSPIARGILHAYGLFLLTPARVWRATHNYHHAHTARTDGEQRGTYTLFTTDQYRACTRRQRLAYRVERHPLTLLLGYLTVFIGSFGLYRALKHPRRHWDSVASLLVHAGTGAALWLAGGFGLFVFAFLIPFTISGAMGAWLFFVQHNFEGAHIPPREAWSHTDASLNASSHLALGPILRWFTGNIGLHHVHHLNPRIPFYRLPAAMRGIPELQDAPTVRLTWRTALAPFRLHLWDPQRGRLVSYRKARRAA